MKNKLIYPLIVVALVACGGDDDRKAAQATGYESVQEGSAPGVTSSIAGPGESVPALTGTNADTTSAFTLSPNAGALVAQPAGGTLAGTLPAGTAYPTGTTPPPMSAANPGVTYRPPATASRSVTTSRSTTSRPAQQAPQQPMYSTSPSEPQPGDTERQPVPPPPSSTDTTTATPTETAPPPAQPQQQPAKKEQEKKKEGDQKPPADDGAEGDQTETAEPPPPPPATAPAGS